MCGSRTTYGPFLYERTGAFAIAKIKFLFRLLHLRRQEKKNKELRLRLLLDYLGLRPAQASSADRIGLARIRSNKTCHES